MTRTEDLSLTLRSEVGDELTFSENASNPDRQIIVEEITTKDGTGFESSQVTFARDWWKRYDDLDLLSEWTIEDPSGKVLHEGAITGRVPEAGAKQVNSTGHFSKFKDKSGYTHIYRDQDTGNWGPVSLERRAQLHAASVWDTPPNVDGAFIQTQLAAPPWSSNGLPRSTASYVAPPGAFIGRIEGDWVRGQDAMHLSSTYSWRAYLGDDEFLTSLDQTSELRAAGPSTFALDATAGNRRFAELLLAYNAAYTGADTSDRSVTWKPVVYGTHGLASITPSTVLEHFLSTFCPALKFNSESITSHPFEIGQLLFDGVDGADVIARLNAFANWDVNVWEDSMTWFGPAKQLADPDYYLDRDRGDGLAPDGRSITEDYPVNGVEVFFNDVLTGRRERIGPDDDYRLRDESDINPCNRQRRDRWGRLDISFPTDEDQAIQIGSVWLAEHLIASRTGEGTAIGTVIARNGQEVPASHIRSGEVVQYVDEEIGRKVYATRYQPGEQINKLTFSDAAATLDAILERIGIKILLLGGK